jgi:uncharacterized lipoprotein YmbA
MGLSGCASSPTQFIILDSVAPQSAPKSISGAPLRLGRIHMPSGLDQPYLVTASGPNTREVSDTIRWISPLANIVRDALKTDLSTRLKTEDWVGDTSASSQGQPRDLTLTIESFMADTDNQVRLAAHWRVSAPRNTATATPQSGRADIRTDAKSGTAGDIAAAMSRALAQLSSQIIMQLQSDQ